MIGCTNNMMLSEYNTILLILIMLLSNVSLYTQYCSCYVQQCTYALQSCSVLLILMILSSIAPWTQ